MRYRDPKTGKVFEGIQQAQENFCPNTLCKDKPYEVLAKNCALCRINMRSNGWYELCDSFCDDHPAEAARLMGYEVIDDKEVNMGKQDKPRLAEVLGVEVGEEFIIREGPVDYKCVINQDGEADLSYWKIGYAINHPESIIRAPRLTDPEIAIMRAVGAKWVSRDDNCDDGSVDLWGAKPLYGDGMYNNTEDGGLIATIRSSALFPSVNPGDCIELEEET